MLEKEKEEKKEEERQEKDKKKFVCEKRKKQEPQQTQPKEETQKKGEKVGIGKWVCSDFNVALWLLKGEIMVSIKMNGGIGIWMLSL